MRLWVLSGTYPTRDVQSPSPDLAQGSQPACRRAHGQAHQGRYPHRPPLRGSSSTSSPLPAGATVPRRLPSSTLPPPPPASSPPKPPPNSAAATATPGPPLRRPGTARLSALRRPRSAALPVTPPPPSNGQAPSAPPSGAAEATAQWPRGSTRGWRSMVARETWTGLHRPGEGRVLAGAAAALADMIGVSVLAARWALVALTFFGGVGHRHLHCRLAVHPERRYRYPDRHAPHWPTAGPSSSCWPGPAA